METVPKERVWGQTVLDRLLRKDSSEVKFKLKHENTHS